MIRKIKRMTDQTPETEARNVLDAFIDLEPAPADFQADILAGLSAEPRSVPPKYFYDQTGAKLFDAICRTEEYYVTRTELAMMDEIGDALRARIGAGAGVLEYGAGSGWKTRKLLAALETPRAYVALDISRDHLITAACDLAADHPSVGVSAVCADFMDTAGLPETVWKRGARRLAYMPGSTIGNLEPAQAQRFLKGARAHIGAQGAFLIGVDLKKSASVLHAAYNDAEGMAAAFNLNLLHRMRRELGAELTIDDFEHYAFYNAGAGRIEMHLVAGRPSDIVVAGERFHFHQGESLHTENSYKYSVAEFGALAGRAGWQTEHVWLDPDRLFSLHLLSASGL